MATNTTTKTNTAKKDAENVMQDASNTAESFANDAQKSVAEHFEKVSKNFEDMTAFGQNNVDAMVKSSEIAAKAAEGISNEFASYSKKAFEDGVAAAKDLAAARTMTELFEKQTAFAQSAFEGFMSQAQKMSEIYVSAAKDITAPLGDRVNAAKEEVKSQAA